MNKLVEGRKRQKNVIILGAASGIGMEAARVFGKTGYGLALGDINNEGLKTIGQEMALQAGQVWTSKVDVVSPIQVASFVDGASGALGHLDVLLYSVGVGQFSPIIDMATGEWDRVIAANLSGAFYCAQAVARQMIYQKSGGALIFVSSTASTHNTNQLSAYCASKAGLNILVKSLASELGNYRIRANAVLPGATETAIIAPMLKKERYRRMLKATIPLGRWAQPGEIAALLLFLASDEAYYINGQSIAIDGGLTTRQMPDWWLLDYTKDNEIDWYELFGQYPFRNNREKRVRR